MNLAMRYGTIMGVYWIAKFTLVPSIFESSAAALLFMALTVAVPGVGYSLTRQFREKHCTDGCTGFLNALVFCMLMYLFAALLVSVAHYIFFRYIDQGSMIATYNSLLEESGVIEQLQASDPSAAGSLEAYQEAVETLGRMRPIELTFQLISSNIFYGFIFSLPTAFFVSRKRKKKEQTF